MCAAGDWCLYFRVVDACIAGWLMRVVRGDICVLRDDICVLRSNWWS